MNQFSVKHYVLDEARKAIEDFEKWMFNPVGDCYEAAMNLWSAARLVTKLLETRIEDEDQRSRERGDSNAL